MSEKPLLVAKIRNGTIIDHIPAGRALSILKLMGITGKEGFTVAIVMNVESRKLGRKDIIKVEGLELKPEDTDKIALLAPMATINVVKEYAVIKKRKAVPPKIVEGFLRCKNPNCVTNQKNEPVRPRFRTVSYDPLKLICDYCGLALTFDDVARQLESRT